jgi:hypothetical protein
MTFSTAIPKLVRAIIVLATYGVCSASNACGFGYNIPSIIVLHDAQHEVARLVHHTLDN